METLKENDIKNAMASVAAYLLEKKADDDETPALQYMEERVRAATARLENITKILETWKKSKTSDC